MPASSRFNAPRIVLTILAITAAGFLAFVVLLAATGAFYFAMGQGGGIDAEAAGLAIGQPAPAINAEAWINGEPPSLDGQVVVVQGWFYDCPYCWKEAPELVELHAKYGDQVAFVGLSPDPVTDTTRVEEFVAQNKLTYPVGYGAIESLQGFEARMFPAIWVIGKNGKVLWNRSVEHRQSLDDAIAAALAGPAA